MAGFHSGRRGESIYIVPKVFDMINARVCNGSGVIKEEPPLDLHQMVVWNELV